MKQSDFLADHVVRMFNRESKILLRESIAVLSAVLSETLAVTSTS